MYTFAGNSAGSPGNNPDDHVYALSGIRPGTRVGTAVRRLHARRSALHVGLNYWYVIPGRAAYGVLKVRHGRVQEVGIVFKSVTRGRAAQRRLFRAMDSV